MSENTATDHEAIEDTIHELNRGSSEHKVEIVEVITRLIDRVPVTCGDVASFVERGIEAGDPVASVFLSSWPAELGHDEAARIFLHRLRKAEAVLGTPAAAA